jgi:hypothetical protein
VRVLKLKAEVVSLVALRYAADPSDSVWLTEASVYLPESAGVVLQAEAAQSAAESAEYYPPLVGRAYSVPRECGHKDDTHGRRRHVGHIPPECGDEDEII